MLWRTGLSQQAMGFLSRQWAFSAPRAFWAPFCFLGALSPPRRVFFDYSTEIAPRTECCTQKGEEMPCTGSGRQAGEGVGPAGAPALRFGQKLCLSAVVFLGPELLSKTAGAQTGRASASRPAKRAR